MVEKAKQILWLVDLNENSWQAYLVNDTKTGGGCELGPVSRPGQPFQVVSVTPNIPCVKLTACYQQYLSKMTAACYNYVLIKGLFEIWRNFIDIWDVAL